MSGIRPARLRPRALRLALASTLICVGAAGARGDGADWFPLAEGGRWSYQTHRERTVEAAGEGRQRAAFSGSLEFTAHAIEGVPEYEIQQLLRETAAETPLLARPPAAQLARERWSAGPRGVRLHARLGPGAGGRIAFEPPLLILPADPAPGRRWRAGRFRDGAVAIEVEGEVVGAVELRVAGRPRDCRHVRHHGAVSPDPDRAPGAAPVSGCYARESWWCRGVGVVRDETRFELEEPAASGDGAVVRASDRFTLTLSELDATP